MYKVTKNTAMVNQTEVQKLVDAAVVWFDTRLAEHAIPDKNRELFKQSIWEKVHQEITKSSNGSLYLYSIDRPTGILAEACTEAGIPENQFPVYGSFTLMVAAESLSFRINTHTQYQVRPSST